MLQWAMSRFALSDAQIVDAWSTASYSELFDLARRQINPVAHQSYRLRQRLVQAVLSSQLNDRSSRIELAMGNLKFMDQASQRSWWDFVQHDIHLVDLATRRGLHTGYLLPEATAGYLRQWLEVGGGMHRAAHMMWDRSFLMGASHHLKTVLDPRHLNAEHMVHWQGRVMEAWGGACDEVKREVFDNLALHATAPSAPASDEYISRRKWTIAWLENLIDDRPSTRVAVEKWLSGAICASGVDPMIEGVLRSHLCAKGLDACTAMPVASRNPRL